MTSVPATEVPAAVVPAAPAAPVVPASLKEAKAAIRAKMRAEPAKAETPAPAQAVKPAETPKPDARANDERVAKAFSHFQRKDSELRKREEALAEKQKSTEDRIAKAEALADQAALFQKDPVEWLKKHGGDDAYKRLTDWKLAGDAQPVEERVSAAEARAAAAEKAIEDEKAARAAEKAEATKAAKDAAGAAQINDYKAKLASQFTAEDRAAAKIFGIADIEQSALDYVRDEYIPELRNGGLDDAAIESELTHEKIAVKVKGIIQAKIGELKSDPTLLSIFGAAQAAPPKQAPKPAPQQPRAPSLNDAMTATTDVGLGDLSLAERKRLVHKRHR